MIITDFKQLEPFRKKSGIYLFTDKLNESKHYGGKAYNRLYQRIAYEHKDAKGYKTQWIDRIIKRYGLLERFTIELIHWWDEPVNNLEVLALETAVIDFYNCLREKGGYNILLFNSDRTGIKHSKISKQKMSASRKRLFKNGYISPIKNKKFTKEHIEKLSGKNNHNYGKKLSKKSIIKRQKTRKEKGIGIGIKNSFFDFTIYTFKNLITNEVFEGYKYDFRNKFNLNHTDVYDLIKKRTKTRKNWILINNIIDYQI